ncbi:Cell cycle serine/threonine-protein kinase cdc5/MSD2 [Podila epicladia]|nr:Cell cycle serine/threonine-protein kinase cdc5/MSD2 [Podila epicladia]
MGPPSMPPPQSRRLQYPLSPSQFHRSAPQNQGQGSATTQPSPLRPLQHYAHTNTNNHFGFRQSDTRGHMAYSQQTQNQQQLQLQQQQQLQQTINTQNMTSAATGITTTNNTNMITTTTTTTNTATTTGKGKARRKDKPPSVPPPYEIHCNSSGMLKYYRGTHLGEGGFASCYQVSDLKQKKFAAKVIQKSELLSHKTKQKASLILFAEIKIHQGLNHKYIVHYLECLEDNDFVYLILELCESRTLMELIKRRKRLTEPEVRYYMRQIVEACTFMHDHKIIHRDLKLGNIFLSHDMNVKIGDFGLATIILNEGDRKKTICGTPNYIAPEILFDTDNGHSFEVDIWSVGVIMYTLLIGKPPFQTSEVKAIYRKIRNNDYVFPDEYPISDEARNLVSALLTPSPGSRQQPFDNHEDPTFGTHDLAGPSTPKVQEPERSKQSAEQQRRLDALGHDDAGDFGEEDADETRRYSDIPPDVLEYATNNATQPWSQHTFQRPTETQKYTQGSNIPSSGRQALGRTNINTNRVPSTPRQTFEYGEQVQLELMEGSRVVSEIRTVNVPRNNGNAGAERGLSYQQFSQAHSRQNERQSLRHQDQSSALTYEASSSTIQQSRIDTRQARGQTPLSRTGLLQNQQQQQQQQLSSMSRSGIISPGGSFSRHDSPLGLSGPSMSASVPALAGVSSRLPVPKSRLGTPSLQLQPQPHQSPDLLSSTPIRSGFMNTFASPKLEFSQRFSGSTPNPPTPTKAHPYQLPDNPLAPSHSPSPMTRRRSSDMASIPGGSAFGKTIFSRRKLVTRMGTTEEEDGSRTNGQDSPHDRKSQPEGLAIDFTSTLDSPISLPKTNGLGDGDLAQRLLPSKKLSVQMGGRAQLYKDDLMDMDVDVDMDMDQGPVQHIDMMVSSISSPMPPPFSRPQHAFGSMPGSPHHVGSQSPRSGTGTVIQTVQGVERPASAMQRSFSQDRELSELARNRGLDSPRKTSRVTQHRPSSAFISEPLSFTQNDDHNSPRSQSKPQQHSFFQSGSQEQRNQGLSQTLKHYSSQPVSLSLSQQYHQQSSSQDRPQQQQHSRNLTSLSTPSLRKSGTEQLWYNPMDNQGASDLLVEGMYRNARSPSPDQTPFKASGPIELGLGSSPTRRSTGSFPSTQPMPSLFGTMSQPSSQRRSGESQVDELYRHQYTSPLQRRNQQAKEQQLLHRSLNAPPPALSARTDEEMDDKEREQKAEEEMLPSSHGRSQQHLHRRRSRQMMAPITLEQEDEPQDSSMDQSSTRLEFEEKRQQQIHQRRKMQQQKQLKQQQRQSGILSPNGAEPGGSPQEQHPSNFNKQSNETTMAGMSSGGHSDEQDHVEVPSTSCVTTNSLSMSMHDQHQNDYQQQQLQQQKHAQLAQLAQAQAQQAQLSQAQQVQQIQRAYTPKLPQEVPLVGKAAIKNLRNKNPDSKGLYEQVEIHLCQMLRAHREGLLLSLAPDYTAHLKDMPEVPTVFIARWIEYARYGVGWYLTNGVMGVRYNDKTIVSLSPNSIDIEIIEAPRSAHKRPTRKTGTTASGTTAPSSANNSIHDLHDEKGFKRRSYADSEPTAYESKDPAVLISSLDLKVSTIKDLERHIDEDGDTQMMVIYDNQNNIVNPATLVRTSTGNELKSLSQNSPQNSQSRSEDTSREAKPRLENESGEIPSLYLQQHDPAEAFYDEWDHDWFLQSLKRVYCRTNKYPPRFEKKLKVQASYKDYMLQLLRGLICWSYEDKLLTRGMPFLTNLFRRKHILMRLSNGIVQINFADHTKVVFSKCGHVLTFMDNMQPPVRLTMSVHQALIPEFFYDPEYPTDGDLLVGDEVRRVYHLGYTDGDDYRHGHNASPHHTASESRLCLASGATADMMHEIDVHLRPRKAILEKLQGRIHGQRQGAGVYDLEDTSLDAESYALEEIEIAEETEGPVSIQMMTFRTLHEELVRRLKLGQSLLQRRRLEHWEDERKEALEREQLARDREDHRRRRKKREMKKGEHEDE